MASTYRPILLIEDNPMDIDLTLRAFAKLKIPYQIQIARDGESAIGFIQQWDRGDTIPLMILLDLKLPLVDGLEVLRAYKSHPIYRKIPVVVLTSSTDTGDIIKAYDIGVNSYIVKPVDFVRFMDVTAQINNYWCILNLQTG
jgi:CheY-like chemotaxis protein